MSNPLLSDASLTVLAVAIALGLYIRVFSGATPLVHPLLLGKQSEVSRTRTKGQSGIFRNWATGHGAPVRADELVKQRESRVTLMTSLQLSLRPSNALKTIADLLDQACTARDVYGVQVRRSLAPRNSATSHRPLSA